MQIDWAATGSMLTGVGTIGSGFAIVLAGFLGRQAVADFRRQKQVEREIGHAEKALASAYKLQSAISMIRSPMSTAAELGESRSELEETDWFGNLSGAEESRTIQSNVFYRRIRSFKEDFDDAIAILPFLKAYFGEDTDKGLRDLIHCRHSLRVYADAYARDTGADPDFSRKIESYIWEGAAVEEGADPIEMRISEDLATLENALLPVVRSNKSVASTKTASAENKNG